MLNDQIIRLTSIQRFVHIGKPLLCKMDIYGIHDRSLLIHDQIGIVGHTVRHLILSFKQVYLMVIDTDVGDRVCYSHDVPPV